MLELRITTGGSVPIYRQIVDQIRWSAATRAVPPGEPLPSVRALAEQLVVNPNTVARAYAELTRDGVIESVQGKGCFIAERRQIFSNPERARRLDEALAAFLNEAVFLDFFPDEIRNALDRKLAKFPDRGGKR